MRKLRVLVVPLVALAALVASGCGAADPAAAKVNDREISQDELDQELDAILGNEPYLTDLEQQGARVRGKGIGTFDTAFVARVLSRQVLLELVHQELLSRNSMPSQAELDEARAGVIEQMGGKEVADGFPPAYLDTLARRSAEVTHLQGLVTSTPVDDAAVKRFYDDNVDEFTETCVAHILVSAVGADGRPDQQASLAQAEQLRAEAERLRGQIVGGADFAAVAAANSKDTGNKDEGGSLGCGPAGRFVPQFEAAMSTLPLGEVSQPVQTQFGFHLIRITERRTQPLEEAAPSIRQRLLQPSQNAFNTVIRSAVDKARISVNPRYGRFDKSGQSPGVVPPESPNPPSGSPTSLPGEQGEPGGPLTPSQP